MQKSRKQYAVNDHMAARFAVTRQAVAKWRAAGADMSSEVALARWLAQRGTIRQETRLVAAEILRQAAENPAPLSPDYVEAAQDVERAVSQAARGMKLGGKAASIAESNARLASFTDYYAAELASAVEQNDAAMIQFWGKEYRAAEKIQQDGQMLAKKLGIDAGELIKKEMAEAYLRAVAYWLVRCVDTARKRLREKLVGVQTAQDADMILDSELVAAVLVQPMARAMRVEGPVELPSWAVGAITDAIDDYVEDGATEAQRELNAEAAGVLGDAA